MQSATQRFLVGMTLSLCLLLAMGCEEESSTTTGINDYPPNSTATTQDDGTE